MSMLGLLSRNPLKYRVSNFAPFRWSWRSFSSGEEEPPHPTEGEQSPHPKEGEQPPQPAEEQPEPFVDLLSGSPEGQVYAKLTGFGRNTLKTDIIHLLEESNLSTDDVKFVYNNIFNPISMMLRFRSQSSYDKALRQTLRKGRLYNLEKIYSGQWDITESHDGRTVMVSGIPRSAIRDDIDRFLSGCNFDPSSFRYVNRPGIQSTVKAVAFRVPTALEAINFCIRKNRSMCGNAPVTVRVLQ